MLKPILFSVLLGVAVLSAAPSAPASDPEQEARAAFAKLVDAATNKRVDDFKALVAERDLAEMEGMEKEQPGFMEMFMGFVAAGGSPDDYTAEVTDDQIKFVRRTTQSSSEGSSTETTTVTMVREGDQWKFGQPRP